MSIDDSAYYQKDKGFFNNVRYDLLPLLPAKINRLLEIGCGSGNTLRYIRDNYQCDFVCGVELFHDAAEIARSRIDSVIEGNIETLDLPIEKESLDIILCMDVLEHLIDPWSVIDKLGRLLKPDGVIIASIPNVRNFRVILPLVLRGKWEYKNEGILDRTHLRFFVRDTAIKLLESSGFRVDMIKYTGLEYGSKARLANLMTFSILKPFFVVQYLIRAKKKSGTSIKRG